MSLFRCFQSELRADFGRIKKLTPLAFQCVSFHPAIRNIVPQNEKMDRNLFRGCNFGSIIVPTLQTRVWKIKFLVKINVAVIWYRHKRQNLFAINSKRNISIQKGVDAINLIENRLRHDKFPKSPGPKRPFWPK